MTEQAKDIIAYSRQMLEEIRDKEARIHALRKEVAETKSLMPQVLSAMLSEIPTGQVYDVASELYWLDEQMGQTVKLAFYGLNIKTKRGQIFPAPAGCGLRCRCCGEVLLFKTWTKVHSAKELAAREKESEPSSNHELFCAACRLETKEEESSASAERRRWKAESLREMAGMTWLEYRKTEHWQIEKKMALSDANEQCNVCGKSHAVDVYPKSSQFLIRDITIQTLLWHANSNLAVLCAGCCGRLHPEGLPVPVLMAGEVTW